MDGFLCRIDGAAEMPFALIGGVVAELLQTVPDRYHVSGHVALPGSLHIVKDASMLDVLTGVDNGTCRRAHLSRSLVIKEGGAVLLQVFPPWHRKGPFLKEMLLIDEHEQNVVARGWCLRVHRGERQSRQFSPGWRGHSTGDGTEQSCAGSQNRAARWVARTVHLVGQHVSPLDEIT